VHFNAFSILFCPRLTSVLLLAYASVNTTHAGSGYRQHPWVTSPNRLHILSFAKLWEYRHLSGLVTLSTLGLWSIAISVAIPICLSLSARISQKLGHVHSRNSWGRGSVLSRQHNNTLRVLPVLWMTSFYRPCVISDHMMMRVGNVDIRSVMQQVVIKLHRILQLAPCCVT